MDVTNSTITPGEALERKQRLGKSVTYEVLSDEAGVPKTTVYVVLTQRHTAIPIDRERVLGKVEKALSRLESKERAEAA